jgi:hypothetical protein
MAEVEFSTPSRSASKNISDRITSRFLRRTTSHAFNAWTRMPSLDEQSRLPEAFTADFTVVRALLQRGRPYEKAVQTFEPYHEIQEPSEDARAGMGRIAEHALKTKKTAFVFVNDRLEGNAPSTIEAVVERVESGSAG